MGRAVGSAVVSKYSHARNYDYSYDHGSYGDTGNFHNS
jgi:hypothetical protein